MSFSSETSDHFSLKQLYRVRRQSLSAMVQDCYNRLLGDPTITILSDSEIIQQHKVQSIERIVQTLIDSESELMVAKLTTEVELLQSQVRMLKERLNHYMVEAEQQAEKQSPEIFKRKLCMLEEEKQQQEQEFKAMLKQYGFEFVNSLQYSLQRVLKEYSFATRGVATREELINRLYKEMGKDNEESSKGSTSQPRPNGKHTEDFLSEIDRLNGLVRTLTESRDSTCSLLQKKLQDAQHKNSRDIKLLKENEAKLRQQVELKLERLEEEKRQLEARTTEFERQNIQLKEDCGLLKMQLEQTVANKQQFEVRIKELEVMFEGMRTSMEATEAESKGTKKELEDERSAKEKISRQLTQLGKQLSMTSDQLYRQKADGQAISSRHIRQIDLLQGQHQQATQSLTRQNMELRQRLVSSLAELELLRSRPSLRVIPPPPEQQPHNFVAEMERLCNERISQFEQDLQQKNNEIVALTKDKLQLLRTVDQLESRIDKFDHTKKSTEQESAALVDDIGIILKTLEFERKLHEQESTHMRKIVASESAKLGKQVSQLKQLLSQKEAALKRLELKRCEHNRSDKPPLKLCKLKEQLNRLSVEFRCLQQVVKKELSTAASLFHLPAGQKPGVQQPLHIHNQTRKLQHSCIRRQSPNHLTIKLAEHERYLRHLDKLLDSASEDES